MDYPRRTAFGLPVTPHGLQRKGQSRMSQQARQAFWGRTKRLTLGLGLLWLAVNLGVPWFARELNALQLFGFPLGYWLAAEGTLFVYLAIIVVYALAMDRFEASYLATLRDEAAASPEQE